MDFDELSTLKTHRHPGGSSTAYSHLARIIHESLAATTDMAVLPGVLGCRPLRCTVQVRLGPIPRYRGTVARWHAHLLGLATAIHELSGLVRGGFGYLIFLKFVVEGAAADPQPFGSLFLIPATLV